ncbi:unnamed protein product [Phyllotreta striolata]|uniref:Hydroxylysine kinase n=1 Tax=Phyllotreta striolata TaxID=444603 RepID=A0A9N9TZF2_PHYSR|nr:unnamed protein product [Phyllotreta striolata]
MSVPAVPDRIVLSLEKIADIARNSFDVEAIDIEELNGYDDKNFRIVDNKRSGRKLVLKIINSIDSRKPELFEAQTLLLLHLGKHGVNCPKPVLTQSGELFVKHKLESGEHIVRLFDYIDGAVLHKTSYSGDLFYQIGRAVAEMNEVMKDFKHEAYSNHKTIWMLESLPQLHRFFHAVKAENRRNLVKTIVDIFIANVLPLSEMLPRGLIHGDVNEQNLLVENGDLKAILDYGDCHVGCYLYELAITMTYMMVLDKNIEAGSHVLAGYSSVRKLNKVEYSLLKVCVCARLCQSLVLGAYKALKDPENTYVLTTAAYGWTLLEKLWKTPSEELLDVWKTHL